jgi:Holliday junction resolvase RusA-like endonuclease
MSSRLAFDIWVPGRPKTKGSMEVVNGRRGVLRESVAGSARWRALLAYEPRKIVKQSPEMYPLVGPVAVDLLFVLPVVDVASGRCGDIDKLVRNVLDALKDAGVYSDDVQVTGVVAEKAAASDLLAPGVRVKVTYVAKPMDVAGVLR